MIIGCFIGICVGCAIALVVASTVSNNNKYYTGGHAAGRVHHKRSWEE